MMVVTLGIFVLAFSAALVHGVPAPGFHHILEEGPKYNFTELLSKSILFYEAQRSGKLPASNRIPWRGDSALDDGKDVGHDLTGGWFDAGDHVKFGFPLSGTVTMLEWGMLRYKAAYVYAGEWENALDSIKWPLDYFIKCHTAPNEFYGQIGDGKADHEFWGRPEDMKMARPAYKITAERPGSDLAGETAAAMAAGSLIFRQSDSAYADILLTHAKQLYSFAKNYQELYINSITQARGFYGSTNYKDELAWAAAWLYKATGISSYLEDAKAQMETLNFENELSWRDKGVGAALLTYEADRSHTASKAYIERFIQYWLHEIKYTPKGLAWLQKWGPNRYAANAAFALLVAAELDIKPEECRRFADNQMNYILGDNGRSYVCGFGLNPPVRPHHRAASCGDRPAPCNQNNLVAPGPNPQVLYGALVGGPDLNDFYEDERNDYVKNEVANDYNSGYQSAIAGLLMKYV